MQPLPGQRLLSQIWVPNPTDTPVSWPHLEQSDMSLSFKWQAFPGQHHVRTALPPQAGSLSDGSQVKHGMRPSDTAAPAALAALAATAVAAVAAGTG
eukprot:1157972-Pelagomonas_calceolata.AAC.4